MKSICVSAFALATITLASAQDSVTVDNSGTVENPKPTWETQKQARTWQLGIPAPRGLITDRNGVPLAQTRLSYNLAISFPTPFEFDDDRALAFARQQVALARGLLGREIPLNEKAVLDHYKNRAVLPFDIIEDLKPSELAIVAKGVTPDLVLRQTYARFYPQHSLAAHIVGYTGKEAPLSVRPIENRDLIFSESEGREGLERVFDNELRGQPGSLHVTFDADGKKSSERIARPPVPGHNVVTTIDQSLQLLCEEVLSKGATRGAIVLVDPNNGEILAMASWPSFDPNIFVPSVDPVAFEQAQTDPNVPLLPRAFRSAYPPGSTFKTFVGLAALSSGKITEDTKFNCPSSFTVGNVVFRNWKKEGAGSLNFVQAMSQSCNTWFYQVGLKTGSLPIIDWSQRLGLGKRTGIPLAAEEAGNIPTDEYMLRVHKRKILNGDVANMSIGQGDILITPLQMAQAMAIVATGGKFHQTRLVKQIQTLDNKVVAAYPDRIRDELPISPAIDEVMRASLLSVTAGGTGGQARVKGVEVAGKTGTAQWGPKTRQRTAAWFAGFAPAQNPQVAFAAVYESDPNAKAGGGSHAAPMIGKVLKGFFEKRLEPEEIENAPEVEPASPEEQELMEEGEIMEEGEAIEDPGETAAAPNETESSYARR